MMQLQTRRFMAYIDSPHQRGLSTEDPAPYQSRLQLRPLCLDVIVTVLDFLYLILRDDLREGRTTKRNISQLRLVSFRFSKVLQPLLFEHLIISHTSDIAVLADLLRSAGRKTITRFTTVPETLELRPVVDCREFSFPTHARASLSNLPALRRLELSRCYFPSFSSLVRILGAIPSLEDVAVENVRWGRTNDPLRAPSSAKPISHGKRVHARGCTDDWAFTWIFAATTLGHQFVVRDSGNDMNPNVVDLVQLVWFLAEAHRRGISFVQDRYDGKTILSVVGINTNEFGQMPRAVRA